MRRFLYTLAVYALLPWAFFHLLWRARRQPDYLRHWGERCGFFAGSAKQSTQPTLWLHAVSVGETRAAAPLVAALRARYPDYRILLTHMTPTGRATSEELFGDAVTRVYLPYDTPGAVRRFLNHFHPAVGLIIETELWPNLIADCHAMSMPLLLVNARLSERSARRYARFPTLTRQALEQLAGIAAIGTADAERLRTLGAPAVTVCGNMKFDIEPPAEMNMRGQTLRDLCGDRPVFLCASTRAGEEALILAAWREKVGPGGMAPLLLIVPRHPQRFDEVARLIEAHGFSLQRRAENTPLAPVTQVWLGDSMGELFAYYTAADLAFIGGSLLDFGSQNLIEACAAGTPVLIGPSTFNFADAAHTAVAAGAARQVADAPALVAEALRLLADAPVRQAMGAAGRAFATHHRGATGRTLALIDARLTAGE